MSFGFIVVTRMLQKYPEIAKKIEDLVSIVGFVHKDDFVFSRKTYLLFRYTSSFFSNRLPAAFAKNVVLRGPLIRATYRMVADKHVKLQDADQKEREERIDFEVGLWQANDIRTYMDNSVTMLTLDLCNAQVDLPVYHVAVDNDRYFDNKIVEQHLNVIYSKVTVIKSTIKGHAPTVVADAKAAAPFVPKKIRQLLSN